MSKVSEQFDEEEIRAHAESRLGEEIEGLGSLREIVGLGGMAAVYRTDPADGESVAVKLMHRHFADNRQLRRRFLREAKLMGRVDHPNAVDVYGRGELETREPYFVMELLEGWEVETVWRNKQQAFPVAEALEVGAQSLRCLQAYHDEGILHRDLKPSNLFLTRSGSVRLIDFGVAHARSHDALDTGSGTALGTPAYMAPEQAMGRLDQLDERTDIFGLGAVLFTLLSGRRIREADNSDEALVMAATEPIDTLARHAPGVPTPVIRLVDRALAWDLRERFESAAEMRREIDALLGRGESALDRSSPPAAKTARELEPRREPSTPESTSGLDRRSVHRAREMFTRLERALHAGRFYGWSHEETEARLEEAYEVLDETENPEEGELQWSVGPRSFDVSGEPVWEPDPPHDYFIHSLFVDGVRRLRLRSSASFESFRAFATWLDLDPETDLPREDDLATALWDLGLEGVDAHVLPVPLSAEVGEEDAAEGVLAAVADRIDACMTEGAGHRLLETIRRGARQERATLSELPDPASVERRLGGAFGGAERELVQHRRIRQLSEAIEPSAQGWNRRIERIVGEVWGECFEPDRDGAFAARTRELAELHLSDDQPRLALRLLLRSYKNIDEDRVRTLFRREILDEEVLDQLHSTLAATQPAASSEGEHAKLLGLHQRFLQLLTGDHFETMLQWFVKFGEPLRRPIREYLGRWMPGREAWLEQRLDAFDHEVRRALLEVVAETGSDAAFELLVGELDHRNGTIRRRALDLIEEHFDPETRAREMAEALEQLLEDEEGSLRLSALEHIRRGGVDPLADVLAERVRDDSFLSRSATEQRETLETLAALDPAKAQEVAIELAERRGLVPNRRRREARLIAMRVLGDIGDRPEALEAVGSGVGWWDSEELDRAASTAAEQIERRLEGDS